MGGWDEDEGGFQDIPLSSPRQPRHGGRGGSAADMLHGEIASLQARIKAMQTVTMLSIWLLSNFAMPSTRTMRPKRQQPLLHRSDTAMPVGPRRRRTHQLRCRN